MESYKDETNHKLAKINVSLYSAILSKDKKGIISLYDEANKLNLDIVDDKIFDEYDKLVDEANEILNK